MEFYLEGKAKHKKKKKKNKPYFSTVNMATPTGSIFYMDAAVSENKSIRKLIRHILERYMSKKNSELLSENVSGRGAVKVLPKTFDHLKWKLTADQKYFLDDFIHIHPDTLKESDYKYASKKTGIPESNLKSIQNTYGSWNKKSVDVGDHGRFKYGSGKALTAPEYDFDPKYRHDIVNFKTISKEEADELRYPKKSLRQKKYESDLLKATGGMSKKSNIKKDIDYDDWAMYYVMGKLNPKDGRINERRKIVEVDFEPSEDYYDFQKSMLNSNKKSKYWLEVEKLLNEFNDVFGTSYTVRDQHDLTNSKSKCIRLEISELNYEDKMIWSSEIKSYIPWSQAPIDLRQEYIKNRPENRMKEIANVDFEDLLNKYLNFDKSMFQGV